MNIQYIAGQLLYLAPSLLAHFIGIVLALIFIRRYPVPSALVLSACVLDIIVSLVVSLVQGYLINQNDFELRSWMMRPLAIGGAVFRAIGFGIMLAAVYSRREPRLPWDIKLPQT